jgi:uncharacterized protein (DUF2267 family)
MKQEAFVGQVQNRAHLASQGAALLAIRATLVTLAERVGKEEAENLAAELPQEIGAYLREADIDSPERFNAREFNLRVCRRDGADMSDAGNRVRVVLGVLRELVSSGEANHLMAILPPDIERLFWAASHARMPQGQ